jgi:hypothetical protein
MLWISSDAQIHMDLSITTVTYHSKIWFFILNFTYRQMESTKYQISIIKLVCSILCIFSFWSPPEHHANIILLHIVLGSFNHHIGITLVLALLQKWHFTSVENDISHRVPPDVTKGDVVCQQHFTSGWNPLWKVLFHIGQPITDVIFDNFN